MNPSPLGIHSHFSANGQCEIGSAMSGGKAVKARDAERGEKGFNHFPKREGRFVAAGFGEPEIRENHSPHMFKLAGEPQLIPACRRWHTLLHSHLPEAKFCPECPPHKRFPRPNATNSDCRRSVLLPPRREQWKRSVHSGCNSSHPGRIRRKTIRPNFLHRTVSPDNSAPIGP